MSLNTLKCNHVTLLGLKGLKDVWLVSVCVIYCYFYINRHATSCSSSCEASFNAAGKSFWLNVTVVECYEVITVAAVFLFILITFL